MLIAPSQPWRMPTTLKPSRRARMVTARIAGLSPGTSPPPVRIPITPFLLLMRMSEFGRDTNLPPYLCSDTDPHYSFRKTQERSHTMARYISLIKFADQGIRNVKDTVKRGDAATAEAEKLKMKIIDEYWTMGAYDGVVLFDAPDDETMTAFACKVSSLGNVKTETMRAFRKDEMESILSKI